MPDTDQHVLVQARRAFEAGRLGQARALCAQLLARRRRNGPALYLMGCVLKAETRFDEAAEHLARCGQLMPRDPAVHLQLGTVQIVRGRYPSALACFEKVLKLRPDSVEALHGRIEVHERRGDLARVRALLEPHLQAGTEDAHMALSWARCLEREDRREEAVALLRRHAEAAVTAPGIRGLLHFRLGRLLEQDGDCAGAFAAYAQANEEFGGADDPEAYRRHVDEIIEACAAERLARCPRAGHGLRLPVLVVGMPRTGSTLVERIIDAHPLARGAGETIALPDLIGGMGLRIGSSRPYPWCLTDMTAADADREGRAYVDALRARARGAKRVVDKHLANYESLGTVSAIVPEARVIDCRRDPMDTCFSCFAEPLAPVDHPYASNLDRLGRRYRQYERLMDHWRSVLDLPLLPLRYEELVADPATVSRTLIEFIGLPWDDRCLRFYQTRSAVLTLSREQVHRPVYRTSVGRASRFEAYLPALRRALTRTDPRP